MFPSQTFTSLVELVQTWSLSQAWKHWAVEDNCWSFEFV